MEKALCFATGNLVPKRTAVAAFSWDMYSPTGTAAGTGSLRPVLSHGSVSLPAPPVQFSGPGNDLMFAVLSMCPTPLAYLESERILEDCQMQS